MPITSTTGQEPANMRDHMIRTRVWDIVHTYLALVRVAVAMASVYLDGLNQAQVNGGYSTRRPLRNL